MIVNCIISELITVFKIKECVKKIVMINRI